MGARELFFNHEVTTDVEIKFKAPQKEELTKFLVEEAGFNPERVKSSIEKLEKAHAANRKPQARMDSFFAVKANPAADAKRKKRLEEGKAKKKQKATEDRKKKGKVRNKKNERRRQLVILKQYTERQLFVVGYYRHNNMKNLLDTTQELWERIQFIINILNNVSPYNCTLYILWP